MSPVSPTVYFSVFTWPVDEYTSISCSPDCLGVNVCVSVDVSPGQNVSVFSVWSLPDIMPIVTGCVPCVFSIPIFSVCFSPRMRSGLSIFASRRILSGFWLVSVFIVMLIDLMLRRRELSVSGQMYSVFFLSVSLTFVFQYIIFSLLGSRMTLFSLFFISIIGVRLMHGSRSSLITLYSFGVNLRRTTASSPASSLSELFLSS